MNGNADRTLVLLHGRGTQPDVGALQEDWIRALAQGLSRDFAQTLDGVRILPVYYGDVTAELDPDRENYDAVLDRADRNNALDALLALRGKDFKRSRYEALPGQSPLKEFLADLAVPLARGLGLAGKRLTRFYPELTEYWENPALADDLRARVSSPLIEALRRGDHIMVISHCIGSVLAYDAFWDLSTSGSTPQQRVHTWLTLGSPLADDDVRHRLRGQPHSFPDLLVNWFNLAAEDDPVCHDESITNDFGDMLSGHHISRIHDYHIYNLTERYGRSEPHDVLGYLCHPRTAALLHNWLNGGGGS